MSVFADPEHPQFHEDSSGTWDQNLEERDMPECEYRNMPHDEVGELAESGDVDAQKEVHRRLKELVKELAERIGHAEEELWDEMLLDEKRDSTL